MVEITKKDSKGAYFHWTSPGGIQKNKGNLNKTNRKPFKKILLMHWQS